LEEKVYVEEEIDLRELFLIVARKKYFILSITLFITVLAFVYVSFKTPIYEVKSVVRIGYIGNTLLENSNVLETKLKLIFGVDNNPIIKENEAIVSSISSVKKVENFMEISTKGYSNEQASLKNKEVVEFLQNEYKYKIDEYAFLTNLGIKNLQEQISYIENVTKVEKQAQIDFLNNVDLTTIENKLKFNKEKLQQYQDNINEISKRRNSNDTQNMLSAMEILNYQNLILNLQNQIENLNKEKQNIISEKIPTLKRDLEFDIKNKLENLKDKIELEKLKLTNNIAKNSEIVGHIQIEDEPIKPKKALMVVVTFVTGLILSIFLVFFMQFINNTKKERE
jgi:uncharacterized protein involved in exopolysaccharide biosynthesis